MLTLRYLPPPNPNLEERVNLLHHKVVVEEVAVVKIVQETEGTTTFSYAFNASNSNPPPDSSTNEFKRFNTLCFPFKDIDIRLNGKWFSLETTIETPPSRLVYLHSKNVDKIHFSQRLYNILQDTCFINPVLQAQVPKKDDPLASDSDDDNQDPEDDDSHLKLHQHLLDQINDLTDIVNVQTHRIARLEGPWVDAEGKLDFETQISASRISLIPAIHRSVNQLMNGVIGDVEDTDSDSGDENNKKKRKIKNSTTMSYDEMNHFKRPSDNKNMVMCPMADIQCPFSKLKDKAGNGLFDEGFDNSHTRCFDNKTCNGPKYCCHTSFNIPTKFGFTTGYVLKLKDWNNLVGLKGKEATEASSLKCKIRKHLLLAHGLDNVTIRDKFPGLASAHNGKNK